MSKRQRIVSKPAPPPAADSWVNEQVDPEIKGPTVPTPEPETPQLPKQPVEQPKEKGKAFPHRISFDTDSEQYRRLKRAGFESDRPLTDIVREAVEDWLKSKGY